MAAERRDVLLERIRDLQARLDEAEETLSALRNGEVDAIIAAGPEGDRVYTLKGADEAYRVMVEEMGEGALTLTLDGLILFSNESFAGMLNRPLDHVIGARLQDFVAAEDAPLVSALLGSPGQSKAEVRLCPDAAAFLPAYLSVKNMDLSGIRCRCAIVTDLRQQKRYLEIAAVLEAVPAGVVIAKDLQCRSILGNRMAHELMRLPPPENLSLSGIDLDYSKSWREIKDGRDIPAEELPLRLAARTGRRVNDYEFDMLFDDGAYRSLLGNALPLFDEAGRPRGAVCALIDITERRRAGEALEQANAELRNFCSALTQYLREPLTVVSTSIERLAEESQGRLGEAAESHISESLAGASRIRSLLNALLDYWRVSERSGSRLSLVDCNQVLAQALEDLEAAIRQNGASVTSGPLPAVEAEALMLERVFETLIGNAIQYRGEAPPSVRISAVNAADRWLFSVRDNGIGVDPKDAERIFGLFERLHGNEIPGTGIGLALCRKIVERHGGRIWVESALGEGAAFRFTVPISLDSTLPGFSSLEPVQ